MLCVIVGISHVFNEPPDLYFLRTLRKVLRNHQKFTWTQDELGSRKGLVR